MDKPTLKAIEICNSHQPMLKPKIAKDYVFADVLRRTKNNIERTLEVTDTDAKCRQTLQNSSKTKI